jgi:hypothetical protein
MTWYWYLVIALAVVVVILLVGFFGNSKLKSLAYKVVVGAENLLGSGTGKEKYELVITNLSKLTKGLVPEWLLKKVANWAVTRMKLLLEENTESTEKHLAEESAETTTSTEGASTDDTSN